MSQPGSKYKIIIPVSNIYIYAVLCLVAHHVWLFAIPWTVAHQAPLSMGILQIRILEWVAMPSCRGSSKPRNWTGVSCIASRFFYQLSYQGSLGIHTHTHTHTGWSVCKDVDKILNSSDLSWDFPVNFVFNLISLHLFNLFMIKVFCL